MVHTPELTLMDAMAAIQILDPRMDGGMKPMPDNLISPCDRLDPDTNQIPFDINAPLNIDDVLWIMDRVSACEAAWLQSDSLSGASLPQTIHTCLWVHCLASLDPAGPSEQDSKPGSLARNILRPFLIGVLKTVGLIWEELSKGNLIDGEDYLGDKAGISLLEDFHPFEAIACLQTAIDWTSQSLGDPSNVAVRQAIRDILVFRRHFLLAVLNVARLDPTLPSFIRTNDIDATLMEMQENVSSAFTDMKEIFSAILQPRPPDLRTAPSSVARSAFDPAFARNANISDSNYAPFSLPPTSPLELPQPQSWRATYEQVLDGMNDFHRLVHPSQGWAQWKSFFDREAVLFQSRPVQPYVRSLRQSAICSDTTVALDKPLSFIAESFTCDTIALSLTQVSLQLSIEPRTNALSKRIDGFVERLAGQLVSHLRNLAQNRSRSKRRLAHSYSELLALNEEAAALGVDLANVSREEGAIHPDLLQASVQTLLLDVMVHCLMSGIELDLYRNDELNAAYWMAARVAEEAFAVWKSILEWLLARNDAQEAKVVHTVSYARNQIRRYDFLRCTFAALSHLYVRPESDASRLTWLLPQGDVDRTASRLPDDTAFTMFCKRFKWLAVARRPESKLEMHELWRSYCKSQVPLKDGSDRSARLRLASDLFVKAAKVYSDDKSDDLSARQTSLAWDPAFSADLCQSFVRISELCSRSQTSGTPSAAPLSYCLLPLIFSHDQVHPWFPIPAA
jgi:hypothetical protein